MLKRLLFFYILLAGTDLKAQQYALTHSYTLYDSFENPATPTFIINQSRKHAINFLIPNLNGDFHLNGQAQTAFKSILFGNQPNTNNISTFNSLNHLAANTNIYLLSFKTFLSEEYNKELGFSIQFRNEGNLDIPSSAILIHDNYQLFTNGTYNDFYNNKLKNQSYWQFSISYREDYNNKLAFGGKLSFLSGSTYSDMNITESVLNKQTNDLYAHLKGNYISSFGVDSIHKGLIFQGFKNPGLSTTFGGSYILKKRYYLTAHLKDLGFILWNKNTSYFNFDGDLSVNNLNQYSYDDRFFNATRVLYSTGNVEQKRKISSLNTQAEMAISTYFNSYKPVLVLNKSITNNNGFIALQNNYVYRSLNLGLNTSYHLNYGFNLGASFMLKSANTEFYFGTEKLASTYYLSKGFINKDENIGKGPTQFNAYLGFNIKFGKVIQTMDKADFVDGLNDKETGYISRLGKKDKKAIKKSSPKAKRRN